MTHTVKYDVPLDRTTGTRIELPLKQTFEILHFQDNKNICGVAANAISAISMRIA